MTLILIGIATAVSTFIGGRLALRFKDRLHLVLGFSAGAVIGVAFFDLLPEAIDMGVRYYNVTAITTAVAVGFIFYMILDRIIILCGSCDNVADRRGHLGAGSLTIHSFLDGVAIGLSFQVSAVLGGIVTVAVLVHDFSDGINTVNLSLIGNGKDIFAKRWLIADALAPLIGIIATTFFSVPEKYLVFIIALFSGFFLYIGASELLPESHHRHPHFWTSFMTVLGILVLYVAIRLANF